MKLNKWSFIHNDNRVHIIYIQRMEWDMNCIIHIWYGGRFENGKINGALMKEDHIAMKGIIHEKTIKRGKKIKEKIRYFAYRGWQRQSIDECSEQSLISCDKYLMVLALCFYWGFIQNYITVIE